MVKPKRVLTHVLHQSLELIFIILNVHFINFATMIVIHMNTLLTYKTLNNTQCAILIKVEIHNSEINVIQIVS